MNYLAIKPEQTAVKCISDHLKSSVPPLLAAQSHRGRETFWLFCLRGTALTQGQKWTLPELSGCPCSSQSSPDKTNSQSYTIQVQERLASAEVGYKAKKNNSDFPTSIQNIFYI